MGRRKQYNATDFINAIPGSGGIISTIAKRVGCDWATARNAIENTPAVKVAYQNECESTLDMAESVVLENIKKGDSADAKWYLAKKGRERGYADRQEITGADGAALVPAQVTVYIPDNGRQ